MTILIHNPHVALDNNTQYPDYTFNFDEQSIDVAHLFTNIVQKKITLNTPIQLNHETLTKYAATCAFRLTNDIILFGIRGALLTSPKNHWHENITFQSICPDHYTPKCVLGVWNQKTHLICAYQGSTVPNAQWIFAQQQSPNRVANLLGQGCHSYYVGPHEPDNSVPHEGAWRLNSLIDVGVWRLRDPNQNGYSLHCEFEAGIPNDNIHCGYTGTHRNPRIQFSSAGCQTIIGNQITADQPEGDFQNFRIMAGQSAIPDPRQLGIFYDYLLIPSLHIDLIQNHNFSEQRFMQGSTGIQVRKIQDRLIDLGFLQDGGFNKGHYNGKTALAVYHFQKAHHVLADGIVKPQDLILLELI